MSMPNRAPDRTAWGDLIDEWRGVLDASDRSPATVTGYVRHVEWLAADAAAQHPSPFDLPSTWLEDWLTGQNWSTVTRRKVHVSLRAFFLWGLNEGLCRVSPLAGVSAVPPRVKGPQRIAAAPAWHDPIEAYLRSLHAAGRQPGTIQQRRWWLVRLGETFADPWDVKATDLELWLSREDWSPSTKRGALSSVRSFYRWAHRTGLLKRSPAEHLTPVSQRRAVPRPAPDDAVSQALKTTNDRVRLAVLIGLYAGLRCGEIAALHSRDVTDEYLHVRGKGGHARLVPLHPNLRDALRRELRRRRDGVDVGQGWGPVVPDADGWLFPSAQGGHLTSAYLGKTIAAAMPDGWTAHTLRHRFGTQAYATSRDLRAVQQLLGHAKPETTAIYAAVPNGALRDAVAGVTAPTLTGVEG